MFLKSSLLVMRHISHRTFIERMFKVLFVFIGLLSMLSACSGGDDSPEPPAPDPIPEADYIHLDSSIMSNGLVFDASGGEKTISFSTNKEWVLSIAPTAGGSTWCSTSGISAGTGVSTVTFIAAENTGYDDRSVSVTIKAGTASVTFPITQKQADALLVTSKRFDVSQDGGVIDVEVKSNISYQLEVSEAAKSWITESESRALTTQKHSFTIAAYDDYDKREGEIYIKSGDMVETVKVYQSGGAFLLLTKDEYMVSDQGETITVEIKSNMDFGVQMPDVDWLYAEDASRAMSSHTLRYVADANDNYDSRTAQIIFYDKQGDLKDTLTVVQAQKDAIVLSSKEYRVGREGGSLDFVVSTNVDFSTEISADWIQSATASRALQRKQVRFTVGENKDKEERTGTIAFVYGGIRQVVKVIQDGESIPYLTFTADAKQTFSMTKAVSTLEYSVNGGKWTELGTSTVTFGGNNGALQIRGKSPYGTNTSREEYKPATIQFDNNVPVSCKGDIRTLIDYENYKSVDTSNAIFCYLFYGCESLTEGPELPATTLADSCYLYMFTDCKSLTEAPELPATTLAKYCYGAMFAGCESLIEAPELPATTLAKYCYVAMFAGCESLIEAPELPAATLAEYCYYRMFYGCKFLTEAPELPATNLASYCYGYMFSGCTALTHAPELPATNLASDCYLSMFDGCTALTQTPELPATNLASNCYSSMFSRCTALTQAPKLPATNLANNCYRNMFNGCTALTQAPELPATNLASGCYYAMFSGCINLTKAPELPAANLASDCYQYMFLHAKNLNQITMLATDISAESCLFGWLYHVSETGTFIKSKSMNSLPIGVSGIPEGWTVINK